MVAQPTRSPTVSQNFKAYIRSWKDAYALYREDGNEDVRGLMPTVAKFLRRLPGKSVRFLFITSRVLAPGEAANDLFSWIPGLQGFLADDVPVGVLVVTSALLAIKVNRYRQPALPPGLQGNPAARQPMQRPQNPPPGFYPPPGRQQPPPAGGQPYRYPPQSPQQPPPGGQPYQYGPPQAPYPHPGQQQQPMRRPPALTYPLPLGTPPPAQPPPSGTP